MLNLLPPLLILLIAVCLALMLYRHIRNDLPTFERGRFWKSEVQLLRILESLLDNNTASQLEEQISYFISKGKYWRYEDDSSNGVELYEDSEIPLEKANFFDFEGDCSLALVTFELRNKVYQATYEVANSRLWGWRITPALPPGNRFFRIKVVDAALMEFKVKSTKHSTLPFIDPVLLDNELVFSEN